MDVEKLRASSTSKLSLKMACLEMKDYDVNKADELYKYIIDGLDSLPDVEPEKPSKIQSIQNSVDSIMGWIGSHKEDILQAYQMIAPLIQKK